ncbi:hypothetical protein CDL15_Pgr002264 [Punica granatum]|uniref:Uncharacterized protein n=1 Tax=Punica granatum TaxID=22663 RepID=A0A218WDV1_PUNGR|nr:hypothetical protein CDL15_Pgr002264 [Punica granatum]
MGQFASTDVPDIPPSSQPRPYLPLHSAHFTAFRTSRPRTSRPDFASPDFASGLLLSELRVRFTTFRTSRPVYCFQDFASPDFASGLLLSELRVRFIAFRTSSLVYCFQDFASPDFASPDFASPDFASGLRVPELRFRFIAFRTSRPIYCFQDFASPDFASGLLLSGLRVPGLRVRFTAFRTSCPRTSRPHLLLSGLLVHFTAFCGLRPFTYHFTFPKSRSRYYLMTGGASYHKNDDRSGRRDQKGASHGLWLHPLTEHATKEGKAVSTPFWPAGFPHEDSQQKPRTLFITRQSEANRRARGHEQWEKS